MYSLLLAIIYISFISLGLPDSMLGSAWPVMYKELGVPVSYAGIISMTIALGTVISSLLSDKLTNKFGAGLVTATSVLTTAIALFGFSVSKSFYLIVLFSIPYGLGAGAVDAALNNYVAINYSSKHMNWLHCFWGIGTSISPYIMSFCLKKNYGWNRGYGFVSIFQIVLTIIIFSSLPLWKKELNNKNKTAKNSKTFVQKIKIKGVIQILLAFFSYSAVEATVILWASTYLVKIKSITPEVAASFSSLFLLGITFGRFISGFISDKLGDKTMIRLGIYICVFGIIIVLLPVKINIFALIGLVITGLGCAPIYPAIIHSTPINFGDENSQAIIGVQMASAYIGTTFIPPLFGFISSVLSISIFPYFILIFAIIMLYMTERLNKIKSLNT